MDAETSPKLYKKNPNFKTDSGLFRTKHGKWERGRGIIIISCYNAIPSHLRN